MHRGPNGGILKIAPPNFSFINLTDLCKFKDFFKNKNAHIFFIFKARLLIFWVIGFNFNWLNINPAKFWKDLHRQIATNQSRDQ